VQRHGESTRIEWVRDNDNRFFPAQKDALFGSRLHLAGIASNMVLAAAGGREPRDVRYIHDRSLPPGANRAYLADPVSGLGEKPDLAH
jgi:hypothetical protein